jgi:AraC-like DNA-binding protein
MIFIAGATLAFFFELLLLGKKSKSLPDKILSFWMFIIGLHLFAYYFHLKGIEYKYPHLLGIAIPFPLIHGPLLFLYAGALTNYFSEWKPKYLLHFLPVLLFFLYYFDFFTSTGQEKIEFVNKLIKNPDFVQRVFYPAVLISGFTYIFLTFLLLRRHHRNILNNLSNSGGNNNLHWLRNLLTGMLIIWTVILIGNSLTHSSSKDSAIFISVSIFVVFIGFYGLRQGNIFMNLPEEYLIEGLTEDKKQHYTKSGLKEEQSNEIKQKLEKLMTEEKLFLDENISLPRLAKLINIHPNYLSQVINERFQKNFYDFINTYRVEEFKRIVSLDKNRNKTFYALALDCGFNSKASFNSSFKKITGSTPSGFVKSL